RGLLRQRLGGEAAAEARLRLAKAARRLCRGRHDPRPAHGVHGQFGPRAPQISPPSSAGEESAATGCETAMADSERPEDKFVRQSIRESRLNRKRSKRQSRRPAAAGGPSSYRGPTMSTQASDLARRLAEQAELVCRHYLSNGRRVGQYWIVGDVHNTPGRS